MKIMDRGQINTRNTQLYFLYKDMKRKKNMLNSSKYTKFKMKPSC